ncbi:MAG TPA: tRNA uridine-5-carboxymethylaminomethyl(34) synthesis GTPase MnmE [Terriglobia bacterium]|nr:tRNA uridine-5-carboxymethylaminomethyl(34) synthesis GTPase MnmE [Terriglobia bacterium]
MREGLHKIASADDTIVALSTPIGRSAIGVVRISGSLAATIASQFFKTSSSLIHRQAAVGLWESSNGEIVDEVVAIFYKAPHSYTGEDVLEISAHGNPLILNQIICMVQSVGARAAQPGEFTLRAVTHGKMDLIQAEAIRNFIDAQTNGQARTALRQIEGAVSKRLAPIKQRIVDLIAHLEAGIDFSEDDVELPDNTQTADQVSVLRAALEELHETYTYGKVLQAGVRIVIAGRPNVGKSSLFNRLVAMDRAIVTAIPGTTRDVLSEFADLDGIPLRFFDTAGVRETLDEAEKLGVTRTLETLSEGDLALLIVDGSRPVTDEDLGLREKLRTLPHLLVANKADLVVTREPALEALKPIWISARTGEGLDALKESMRSFLGSSRAEGLAESVLTTARQNDAVVRAVVSLRAGELALRAGTPHEMVLLDLYASLSALNELTGEITTEDILGRIFSTFCIGK